MLKINFYAIVLTNNYYVCNNKNSHNIIPMKTSRLFMYLMAFALLFSCTEAYAAPKKKSKKGKSEEVVTPPETPYIKLIKDCKKQDGLFATYLNDKNELFFEIPDSLLGRDYLLSNRLATTSNPKSTVAGQMIGRPVMVRFSRNEQMVFMHLAQTRNIVADGDEITPSFNKNFTDPIVASFKIESKTDDKQAVVVNVTKFFNENTDIINPQGNVPEKNRLKGGKGHFQQVKTFPNNIELRSVISYTGNKPLTLTMHRSLVLLPETPMQPRYRDKRVGFFSTTKNIFTSSADMIDTETFIHRWRLEPREEDREAYFRGELVEPVKPIVFYVDTAFPVKWRATIRQGVEDWNTAFEQAGFKNAIIALDYPSPEENPDFDPDDMRYSCVKYATTDIANAMGPSFVDPRSGEILTADVIWYHNVLSLVHNWRFAQTAAVDPRVRKNTFDDNVMCESLRYVASHEIGHTIGLMHNMGASYSFPIDSLRSPQFTQKYGTTPSIMDYARNNYIAQPGDMERGVKLTPPILGVYDIYAIEWGYRYYDVNSAEEERPILTALIEKMNKDAMFEFGAQQFPTTIDPTDQTEDLGNDHLRAGDYAIANLRIITANMLDWLQVEGDDYNDMVTTYSAIVSQYRRHIGHVVPYIGGIVHKEVRQGDDNMPYCYIDRTQQKAALQWLLQQNRSYREWLTPDSLLLQLGLPLDAYQTLHTAMFARLLSKDVLYRIYEGGRLSPATHYTVPQYLDDLVAEVFKYSRQNKPLDLVERDMQSAIIQELITHYEQAGKVEGKSALALEYDALFDQAPALPCSHTGCHHDSDEELAADEFSRSTYNTPAFNKFEAAPYMLGTLKKIQSIYRTARSATANVETRNFYDYQLLLIEQALDPR